MVSRSLDPSERISLLHMIGELYEIAGEQPDKAFEAIGRADTLAALPGLLARGGDVAKAVGARGRVAHGRAGGAFLLVAAVGGCLARALGPRG